jgi:Asp-tRNA(Asn)/Glu-tRNA(Gln) amidotransferase A subunit family amidase
MTDTIAIAENLSRIRARIAEACARASRPANAVTLVAVSKTNPVEAVEAFVKHIARWEPALCAMYAYDPQGALADARASQARWQAGTPLSPLDGVPVTVKENIATRGVPMPAGTAASELHPAPEDAPPAARLREAGCILLGKTTMPDYGMLTSGLSSFHALARNPWDLRMNPGGSSAGRRGTCSQNTTRSRSLCRPSMPVCPSSAG